MILFLIVIYSDSFVCCFVWGVVVAIAVLDLGSVSYSVLFAGVVSCRVVSCRVFVLLVGF